MSVDNVRVLRQPPMVYRDATLSIDTRATLSLAIEVLERSEDPDAAIAVNAVRDVCARWDANAATEIMS